MGETNLVKFVVWVKFKWLFSEFGMHTYTPETLYYLSSSSFSFEVECFESKTWQLSRYLVFPSLELHREELTWNVTIKKTTSSKHSFLGSMLIFGEGGDNMENYSCRSLNIQHTMDPWWNHGNFHCLVVYGSLVNTGFPSTVRGVIGNLSVNNFLFQIFE